VNITVDPDSARANGRLTAVRLAILTTRFMENWRRGIGELDLAMILVAVVAITGERLTRAPLDEDLRRLKAELPQGVRGECNISSIAAATGLNRETARRKVNALIEAGFLSRSEGGEISFSPDLRRKEQTDKLLRKQLEALVRLINELLREGVLRTD
jgi:predicted transcriptional regulator